MANDSPAKSLGDIDLSSLRVSVTEGKRGSLPTRPPFAPLFFSLLLATQKRATASPGVAFVVQSRVGAERKERVV